MGMAASQARFLSLTARKSNVEYEGQQINQQRTTLSNESANYYSQLCNLVVPTPPSSEDYSKTTYTFVDGSETNTINSLVAKQNGLYILNYTQSYETENVVSNGSVVTTKQTDAEGNTSYYVGSTKLRAMNPDATMDDEAIKNDAYLSTLESAEVEDILKMEQTYLALLQEKYGDSEWYVRYQKNSSTGSYEPVFYNKQQVDEADYSDKTSASFISCFDDDDISGRDITTDLKAVKNETEREGMRRSHVEDAIAYVNFLAKLDRTKKSDEIAISSALEKERERREDYLGPSFAPISGFSENGAMCHYSATKESNLEVSGNGLLVLDTGSQFEYGMTDITRTLLFGEASDEERKDYTLVLKGHLALSRQRFIKGTCGVHLDVLAKQFLWQSGESFFHGTGHGVGCHLNVHEGPMKISSHLIDVPLLPGMVLSDEPGVYKEGRHGIRIENLLMVRDDETTEFGKFYSFEVLTLVPYEKALINSSLLSDEEIDQINSYHKRIYDTLKDKVDSQSIQYLINATSPIAKK